MLFLDTADKAQISALYRAGLISGVTTNPTILCRAGIQHRYHKDWCEQVCDVIQPTPLSYEVTSDDLCNMLTEAQTIADWGDNMVVKVPIHGILRKGVLGNIGMISNLERIYNIRVNVTAMMTAQQCYLAALAGATYVSLFGGRVADMGGNVEQEIRRFIELRDRESLKAKLIVGSVRDAINVIDWLVAGADIVTVPPQYFTKMVWHPYTAETVQQFLRDAANVQ